MAQGCDFIDFPHFTQLIWRSDWVSNNNSMPVSLVAAYCHWPLAATDRAFTMKCLVDMTVDFFLTKILISGHRRNHRGNTHHKNKLPMSRTATLNLSITTVASFIDPPP